MTGCDGADVRKIEDPLETLPSPVIPDDMHEELKETLKFSLENSISELLDPKMVGLVKSSVKLG